jgi:hypothetical protein
MTEVEIAAIRAFRKIVRAQEIASLNGADYRSLCEIATKGIIQAVRDFPSTAARPSEDLPNRIIEMLEA